MNIFPSRLALLCDSGEPAAARVLALRHKPFQETCRSRSPSCRTCRNSCSQTGWPWHCKQHKKPLNQTWKKAASGHRQGQNTGHREEHSNRSRVGRKQLQVQNAEQGIAMGSTGMETLRLWGMWNCTREVTLDKLSFLKSSFNSAA